MGCFFVLFFKTILEPSNMRLLLTILLLFPLLLCGQTQQVRPLSVEVDYYYGSILEHNPDINHLIIDHPGGFTVAVNRKTYGFNAWERRYNYPDWGFTFAYQDLNNPVLGEAYSLYGHFNFYFLNRNLQLRIGQGIAYNTNPYDSNSNYLNNAYGTSFLSSTMLKANYSKENLFKGWGLQVGFTIIHYSNANLKAPNNSTNTFAVNAGVNYLFDHENFPEYIPFEGKQKYSEPIKFNFVLRSGYNEADIIALGQYPFYIFSLYADKRINYKSSFQFGTELFLSEFLRELIRFRGVAFPEEDVTGQENWKRIGLFIGHELRFNKVAFVSQLGYYLLYDFDFEGRFYNRLGLKRYFGKNENFFGVVTVKAHGAKAEAVEFGVGIRFNKF